ncbi:MAG: MATE family efflux transporter [Sphingobacteriia bacterium]|nr:MATE family efflux transporter [Sphingobacteriia bacterium]
MSAWLTHYRPHISATLNLSYPMIIGQLGLILMGVADNIMVGRVGAPALAACGVANALFFLFVVIGTGALAIISPMVAGIAAGGKGDSPGRLLATARRTGWIISAALMLLLSFLNLNFHWLGQSEEVTKLAIPYLFITIAGIPFMLDFWSYKQITDGLGYTQIAMKITILGLLTNIFLNLFLIYGFGPIPALGLNGAGISTLVSRIGMNLFLKYQVQHNHKFKQWIVPSPTTWKRIGLILKKGLPAGFQYFFELAAFSGAAIVIGWMGTASLAAHQIAINLASISYMAVSGIAGAGAIRVGQYVGLKQPDNILRAGITAAGITLVIMFICALIFLVFRDFLIHLYIDDPEVHAIAATLLLVAAVFQLSDGLQVVGLGILRGLHDVNFPTVITLIAYWVIGIPLGYMLAMHFDFGVLGIWLGLLAGLTASAILLMWRFWNRVKQQVLAEEREL